MGVPYVFGNATTSIPLTNLDANFNTGLTIGNTTVGLGNTVTTLGNVTLTNATIVANTSSIAANAVVYTTSTGNLTGNASIFTVNAGNVGIGTISPAAKLEVYVTRTSSTNAAAIVLNDNVTGAQTDGVYKSIQSRSNNGASVSEIRFLETDGTNNNTGIALATAPSAGGITEVFRVNSVGNIALKGANTGITGVGITFPATQSASSDANTLDDYEEGTFTPSFTNTGSFTYVRRTGYYTKIGNVVNVYVDIIISAQSGSSGTMTVGGFPFATSTSYVNNPTMMLFGDNNWTTPRSNLCFYNPTTGGTTWNGYFNSGTNLVGINITDIGQSGRIMVSGSYITST